MHEMMVADSLLQILLHECEGRPGRPVLARISCGQLNPINQEVLAFALEAIAQGTLCEGIHLEVDQKPLQAQCRACNQVYGVGEDLPLCPGCGSSDFGLLPDAPLTLETIEFEEN
jgi:hydrogenase nickel incorporation protein HypA/HybF